MRPVAELNHDGRRRCGDAVIVGHTGGPKITGQAGRGSVYAIHLIRSASSKGLSPCAR
jgi:hypothetical protein